MADLSGQTLGKYQLIERLGRGGMADVYKGYQPGLDRYVAVKVLHPHLSEEANFITRFQREAKGVANLRHPNIVQVFDFDVQAENYYMVMEYIEGGQTLKEMLLALAASNRRLPYDHTLDIVSKIADALSYAHRVGMVHRDIKPSNILMRTATQPVLGDFGIARLVGQTGLTSSGAMIGTPAYMSPEQGRGERADERSDIYALGIVLYEMLTGQPPYDADTPYGIILKHINNPLTPPRQLAEDLPQSVERVVLKSLAKNPDDRFQTAQEMHDALAAALADLEDATMPSMSTPPAPIPVHAAMPDDAATVAAPNLGTAPTVMGAEPDTAAPQPVEAPRRKRKWWIWAAAAAAVIIIGGVLLSVLSPGSPATEPPMAEEAAEPGEEASREAEALVANGTELLGDGEIGLAIEAFSNAIEIDPGHSTAYAYRAIAYLEIGEEDAAAEDVAQALGYNPESAIVQFANGELRSHSERYYDPDEAMQAYTFIVEELCGQSIDLCASAYQERAAVFVWELDEPNVDAALEDLSRAIELKPEDDELYGMRGIIKSDFGDIEGAYADLETAFSLNETAHYHLEEAALIAVRQHDYQTARSFYDRLLEIDPENAYLLAGRGYVEMIAGEYAPAWEFAEHAARNDPALPQAQYLNGLLLLELGDPEGAMEQFDRVTHAREEYDWPFLSTELGHEIHYDMARAVLAMDNWEQALELIEASLEYYDYWPQPYILRGMIYAEHGDIHGAEENYEMALEIAEDPEIIELIYQRIAELSE